MARRVSDGAPPGLAAPVAVARPVTPPGAAAAGSSGGSAAGGSTPPASGRRQRARESYSNQESAWADDWLKMARAAWRGPVGRAAAAGSEWQGAPAAAAAARRLEPGDEVYVFFRFETHGCDIVQSKHDEFFFPVSSADAALHAPRIAFTDTWLEATVVQVYINEERTSGSGIDIEVRLHHDLWGNRTGELHVGCPPNTLWFDASSVHQGAAKPHPEISFMCMRWSAWSPPHNTDGAVGGWGEFGSCVCDIYISSFFQRTYGYIGPTYEVVSIFVHQTSDLAKIQAPAVAAMLRGRVRHRLAGLYYLWPTAWLDGHGGDLKEADLAGYVEKEALFDLMVRFEGSGIPTRHPHPSHLYRLLTSKYWSAHLCTTPSLSVPVTTRVNRALVLSDALGAARAALSAMRRLGAGAAPAAAAGTDTPAAEQPIKGVAKLGFAWEAREVLLFNSEQQLAERMRKLVSQPGGVADSILVQEFIPHDCEMRVYCLHGEPRHCLFTKFSSVNSDGKPETFSSLDRAAALKEWFRGDDKALSEAEHIILKERVPAFIRWLLTESCETPAAIRMDFFIKLRGPEGKPVITIGELTEQGASTLAWRHGALLTHDAVLESCLGRRLPADAAAPLPGWPGVVTVEPGAKRRKNSATHAVFPDDDDDGQLESGERRAEAINKEQEPACW
eukprot:TRINITY_DN3935_c1_g1_i1.p1 TRINITY_DN3935_c1_g1~~TRINITY_DN3935_c1_g1_i1.p1  ORF type:complete len:710 (+),score=207.55 TRINITY_DN3935_c1_g1_i1:114-2132(+)